jgi:large subunit ribosomal protein L4
MKLKLYSSDGSAAGERDFLIPEFTDDKGLQVLKQVVLAYQANQRLGTVSTKTRSTVTGTGKKPFRQKGTGRSRQGSMRGPQHYHGSVAHGPQPRDFSQRINKKMRQLALKRALWERAKDGEVLVIEAWDSAAAKTRAFNAVVSKVAPAGRILVVDDQWSDNTILSARNIERLELSEAANLNALDFVRYDQIVLSEKGITHLLNRVNGDQ